MNDGPPATEPGEPGEPPPPDDWLRPIDPIQPGAQLPLTQPEAQPPLTQPPPAQPEIQPPPARRRTRGRAIGLLLTAAVAVGAVVALRSGVEPPPEPAVGPDGQQIRAFHDADLIDPPQRPVVEPLPPGELRFDDRRNGVLVHWPAAPFGFEVRWGRTGGPLDQVRYVAAPSTSLTDLEPGDYRVEVRSVDEIGRRSEPTGGDVKVSDDQPSWARGLGFVDDFDHGADLDPARWRVSDSARRCLRRAAVDEPLQLNGQCFAELEPVSPLVLSEPDDDGVRGRVALLADTLPRADLARPDMPRPGAIGSANDLLLIVGETALGSGDSVTLRINSEGAFLGTGGWLTGSQDDEELSFGGIPAGGPGALHRWELVFTADEVQVHRNGELLGGMPMRPEWSEAQVSISTIIVSDVRQRDRLRIGLVGLTGPEPDGRPVESIQLGHSDGGRTQSTEMRVPVMAVPTAETASVRGIVMHPGEPNSSGEPQQAPPTTIEYAGVPLQPTQSPGGPDDLSYWFRAEVPIDAVGRGGGLVIRSADGAPIVVFDLHLDIAHRPGTVLDVPGVPIESVRPELPQPRLVVRSNGQEVAGHRLPPGDLEIEVIVESAVAQGAAGSVIGWVALRVELDDEPVLDHPTSAAGPAIVGTYRFTLNTAAIESDGSSTLEVRLVPDRGGVASTSDRFTFRVRN